MIPLSARPAWAAPLIGLLAALLALVGLGATATAAPAQAEPEVSCTFTEVEIEGRPHVELTANDQVWLFTWADGGFRSWSLTTPPRSVPFDAQALADVWGQETLSYRAYPYGIDQSAVTYATPALCEITYTAEVPDPVAQTITFPALRDMVLSDAPQDLLATASSHLYISYTSATPATCEILGLPTRTAGARKASRGMVRPQVSPLANGICTVTASQPGGVNDSVHYAPATPVSRSFTIGAKTKAAQRITHTGRRGTALSSRTAPIRFRSSAGLPVRVASATPAVCGWADGTVRLRKAGTCTLTASAAGNATYAAAAPVRASFAVWGAPWVPARAAAPRVLDVLGRGEQGLRVTARPAGVCAIAGGRVALVDSGTCTIAVATRAGRTVRRSVVEVREIQDAAAGPEDMRLAGSVRFGYRSAVLTKAARTTLRRLAPSLRKADLVAVYGNTQAFGAGDVPANRRLSQRRARVVVAFLRGLGVDAQTTEVAMGARNPVSQNDAANRRADIYALP